MNNDWDGWTVILASTRISSRLEVLCQQDAYCPVYGGDLVEKEVERSCGEASILPF
jgi:hypothetical protein